MVSRGLLINPTAGGGLGEVVLARVASLLRLMAGTQWLVPSGSAGERLAAGAGLPYRPVPFPVFGGAEDTVRGAAALVRAGAEMLVVVGGDGTLADAAWGLRREGLRVPLLGLGAGTTNVGGLIAVELARGGNPVALPPGLDPARLRSFPWQSFRVCERRAVCAQVDGLEVGVGFNDAVVGFTVPRLLGGCWRDADVESIWAGRPRPGQPRPLGPGAWVQLLSGTQHRVARDLTRAVPRLGQVSVAPLEGRFRGKVLAGGTCLAELTGALGVLILSTVPLVRVELGPEELRAMEPVASASVALFPGDKVEVGGCPSGSGLCLDGNVRALLGCEHTVCLYVECGAAQVLQWCGDALGAGDQ